MYKPIISFVVATVLTIGFCQLSSEPEEDFYGFLERECLQEGGLCIIQQECSQEIPGNNTELCPEQAKDGFRCCSGLAVHDQRCRMHGGECSLPETCSPNLLYANASDCGQKQVCCLLE